MSRRGPERKIEDEFVEAMEHLGWLSRKGDVAAEMRAGEPDRYFFGPKRAVVIVEFKRDKAPKRRRGEKLQAYTMKEFESRGFPVYRIYGKADAVAVFLAITGEMINVVLERSRMDRRGAGRAGTVHRHHAARKNPRAVRRPRR